MTLNSKLTDERSANYSFACTVNFTRDAVVKIMIRDESYPADEMHFGDKDIHKQHQISFTLRDNTKAADETSVNYSFECTVDFTVDPAHKITMTDASYPKEKIHLYTKMLTINIRSHLLCMITLKQHMRQVQITVLPAVWTSPEIQQTRLK